MAKTNWKTSFSQKISNIGIQLGEEHVHSDEFGFNYYIRQLTPGRPLLLRHYRGPLFVVIPTEDYNKLEQDLIDVGTYVDTSYWSYGYFWGGGSLLGAYWQPLEDGPGIHERTNIFRYLKILGCRTANQSSGYRPNAEHCGKCRIDCTTCPFSPCNQTGSCDKEVQEYDPRVKFLQQLQERTGATLCCSHTEQATEVHIRRYSMDTVIADVPQHIINDMLYYPKRDWSHVIDDLTFVEKPVTV